MAFDLNEPYLSDYDNPASLDSDVNLGFEELRAMPGYGSRVGSRLAGAVWGHLVGDAMGVPYEFRSRDRIGEISWGATGTHRQPAGTWSDDGGLMLALLDSLLSAGFDPDDQARRSLAWLDGPDYKPGPVFDVGMTTSAALRRFRTGVPALESGGRSESDNGNGSLMRILPVALCGRNLPDEELVQQACLASRVTHAHPRAQAVCALYCLVVRQLIVASSGRPSVSAILRQAIDAAARHLPADVGKELPTIREYGDRSGSGYVVDSFSSAWAAFASTGDYIYAVARAIGYGNDTDTTACVAGGLAGARWGIGAVYPKWRSGLRSHGIAEDLLERLLGTMSAEEAVPMHSR
jgi:ADP-ribosylglycohydrolase